MSYAVLHMQKIKMGGVRGIQNHNERLKESHTNPDIDKEKSYLNKNLYDKDQDKTYYNRIRDRVKELNLAKAVRKDAVTMCGFVCTSDKGFFDDLSQDGRDKFFKESYDFLKNRYGEKNIIAANVHYDESTPHMHCYITPVTSDGRLCAKDIFTKTELRQLQTDYHKHMTNKGFQLERGESREEKRRHLDTEEYKIAIKEKQIEENITKLEQINTKKELEIKEQEKVLDDKLKAIRNDFKGVIEHLNNVGKIKGKKSLLGGKITLTEDDYNKLMYMADIGIYFNSMEKSYSQILAKYNNLVKQLDEVSKENTALKAKLSEKTELSLSERMKYAREISDLKNENKKLNKLFDKMDDYITKKGLNDELIKYIKSQEPKRELGMER